VLYNEFMGKIKGLKIEDIKTGNGEAVKDNDLVSLHYTGWLLDTSSDSELGSKFDSSRDRDVPFEVRIGAGYVIKGWDLGVPGMKVGGIRKLTIAPELAYGRYGVDPDIPGDATLIFEIELLKIK
jgi:FKBP-type peptidyl-prolyl cis-trans isomerase FkpA